MSRRTVAMATTFLLLFFTILPGQDSTRASPSDEPESLRVRVEIASGSHFAGQAFEMEVGVVAAAQRPEIEPPKIAGARLWPIGTDLRPIATSGIGEVIAQDNLFVTRFRVVTNRPGTLEIPPIAARINRRSGRSAPRRIEIQPVPLSGRPAEFLGGVGAFHVKAEAAPSVIRFGQELRYRITVNGPAAWGSSGRPDLARTQKSQAGLRIIAEPDEATNEPPSHVFVYRIRPSRAGELILPPVAIAALDPAIKRYVTKVTSSVSVRVVDTPSFNPASIEGLQTGAKPGRARWVEWTAWTLSAAALLGAFVALARVRKRRRGEPRHRPAAARAFASQVARALEQALAQARRDLSRSLGPVAQMHEIDRQCWDAAHRINDNLTRYLELASGRPPGALTPIEARQGVAEVTGSDDLGGQAERLAAQCDRVLYGEQSGELDARDLLDSARQLFGALGLVRSARRNRPPPSLQDEAPQS